MGALILASIVVGIFLSLLGFSVYAVWRVMDEYCKGLFFLLAGGLLTCLGAIWSLFLNYEYWNTGATIFVCALYLVGIPAAAVGTWRIRKFNRAFRESTEAGAR